MNETSFEYILQDFERKTKHIGDPFRRADLASKHAFTKISSYYTDVHTNSSEQDKDRLLLDLVENTILAYKEIVDNPKYNSTDENNLVDRDLVLHEVNEILAKHGFYE